MVRGGIPPLQPDAWGLLLLPPPRHLCLSSSRFSPSITLNLVPLDWAHQAPPLASVFLLVLGITLIFHGGGHFRGSGGKTCMKKVLVWCQVGPVGSGNVC